MALMDRLLKIQTLKHGSVLSESELFNDIDVIKTDYPLFNVALSGSLDGGLTSGITFLCGPSKHFKSMLGLMLVKSYFEKYPDSICMFYDSEFGITKEYLSSVGIDPNRVIHQPIMNMEELKFDIMAKLEEINRGDKIVFFIDSIGGLASKKEVEDAKEEKSAADMTRAKQFKGLWRMLTPIFPLKNIPLIAINHSYKDMCLDGNTKIKTEHGIIPIKDIKVGDRVYAINGLKLVTHIYSPEDLDASEKKFLELEFDDGTIVKCTSNHKFLTKDKTWKCAIDLKIGEEMY
jgi:hypothetical protein